MGIDKSSQREETVVAVRDRIHAVLGELFQRIAIQYPKSGGGRLQKTKTRLEKERMLRTDLTAIFNDVKREVFREAGKSKRQR
jgi:hypothetical protein